MSVEQSSCGLKLAFRSKKRFEFAEEGWTSTTLWAVVDQ